MEKVIAQAYGLPMRMLTMKDMIFEAGVVKELREQSVELIFYADFKITKNDYSSQGRKKRSSVVMELFLPYRQSLTNFGST